MNLEIPQPMSGGLMLSYRCNAACGHCMYACGPDWEEGWIDRGDLEYIPFERTERAVRVSRELFGGNTLVYQMDYYRLLREGIDPGRHPVLGFLARGDMRGLLGFTRERGYPVRGGKRPEGACLTPPASSGGRGSRP